MMAHSLDDTLPCRRNKKVCYWETSMCSCTDVQVPKTDSIQQPTTGADWDRPCVLHCLTSVNKHVMKTMSSFWMWLQPQVINTLAQGHMQHCVASPLLLTATHKCVGLEQLRDLWKRNVSHSSLLEGSFVLFFLVQTATSIGADFG